MALPLLCFPAFQNCNKQFVTIVTSLICKMCFNQS